MRPRQSQGFPDETVVCSPPFSKPPFSHLTPPFLLCSHPSYDSNYSSHLVCFYDMTRPGLAIDCSHSLTCYCWIYVISVVVRLATRSLGLFPPMPFLSNDLNAQEKTRGKKTVTDKKKVLIPVLARRISLLFWDFSCFSSPPISSACWPP